MTDQIPLYPDEATIAVAVLGQKRAKEWPRIAQHLQDKHGLPPVDAEMGGRFWPAVVAYFRFRHGLFVDGWGPPNPNSRIRVVPFNPNGKDSVNKPPPGRRGRTGPIPSGYPPRP
jgi:hypothetical protein